MEAALQVAQQRQFGLRRVPPLRFQPAPPESPIREFIYSARESLQECIESARLWLASRSLVLPRIKFPQLPSIRFDRLQDTALPGHLRYAGLCLTTFGSGIVHAAVSRLAKIEFKFEFKPAERAIRPSIWSSTDTWRGVFVRVLAYVAGIGVLSALAAELFSSPAVVAATDPAPMRREWIVVDKPFPAFHLGLPGFTEEGQYTIHRHAEGGGRKDIMTWGEPGRSLRYVMVEVYRPGDELDAFGDAASEIAARAADLGPASAARTSLPIKSKFGPAVTVDFVIGRFGGGHCVGFARTFDEPRLQISGLSCNMDSIVDREAISCALDRLTLMSAGSHPDVAKLFAHAELKRTFCGQRDPLMYATPKRPGDTGNPPPLSLRGRMTSR